MYGASLQQLKWNKETIHWVQLNLMQVHSTINNSNAHYKLSGKYVCHESITHLNKQVNQSRHWSSHMSYRTIIYDSVVAYVTATCRLYVTAPLYCKVGNSFTRESGKNFQNRAPCLRGPSVSSDLQYAIFSCHSKHLECWKYVGCQCWTALRTVLPDPLADWRTDYTIALSPPWARCKRWSSRVKFVDMDLSSTKPCYPQTIQLSALLIITTAGSMQLLLGHTLD